MGEPASQLNNEPTESNSEPTLIHSPHIEKPKKTSTSIQRSPSTGRKTLPPKTTTTNSHTPRVDYLLWHEAMVHEDIVFDLPLAWSDGTRRHCCRFTSGMKRWYMTILLSIYHWHEAMVHDDIVVDLPLAWSDGTFRHCQSRCLFTSVMTWHHVKTLPK